MGKNVTHREPNGRLSRSFQREIGALAPAEIRRIRDEAARGVRGAEWGTELGRLFLEGRVAAHDFEAGKRWNRMVVAYHQAIGCPAPFPKCLDLLLVGKSTRDTFVDPADAERIEAMRSAHEALSSVGRDAVRAVRSVCEENEVPVGLIGFQALLHGLRKLALYWGLISTAQYVSSS